MFYVNYCLNTMTILLELFDPVRLARTRSLAVSVWDGQMGENVRVVRTY